MTMQVGMVGTNGVMLVSDTKYINQGSGVRHSFNASKITVSSQRGIAISRAYCMEIANKVAAKIVTDLEDSDFACPIVPIERIASSVIDGAGNRKKVECLIAFSKPFPRLFYLQSGLVDSEVHCEQIDGAKDAGDRENPAIFWRERYYRKLPINHLVPLAAHLVVSAGKINNAAIDGLEIVLCKASGIHRLSGDSILDLQRKAKEWDKSIGNLFLNHRQQFTYAPHMVG